MTPLSLLLILSSAAVLILALAYRHHGKIRSDASKPLTDRIDAVLPQTQCGQCGYLGCRPYAEALAAGKADINQCPPGGDKGIRVLARLLNQVPKPLDISRGRYKPRAQAVIDESTCIGCTLCIQSCPVDAIVGAAKRMHTVIAAECTGCELCLPPCPVNCIEMVPVAVDTWHWPYLESPQKQIRRRANIARSRFEARQRRLEKERLVHEARLAQKRTTSTLRADTKDPKQIAIQAAVERVKAKKAALKMQQGYP